MKNLRYSNEKARGQNEISYWKIYEIVMKSPRGQMKYPNEKPKRW